MKLFETLSALFNKPESESDALQKLGKAAETGDLKEVERIVARFPDAPKWNKHITAAQHGNNDIMLYLLDRGADIEARDFSFNSALAHAAFMGQEKTAKLLIERGANPAGKPLERAHLAGRQNIVALMGQADKLREEHRDRLVQQKTEAAEALADDVRQGARAKIGILKKIRLKMK